MQQYRYIDIYRYDIPNAMLATQGIDILHDDIARIHIDGFFLSFAVYKESLPTHLFINTTTSILSFFFFY